MAAAFLKYPLVQWTKDNNQQRRQKQWDQELRHDLVKQDRHNRDDSQQQTKRNVTRNF